MTFTQAPTSRQAERVGNVVLGIVLYGGLAALLVGVVRQARRGSRWIEAALRTQADAAGKLDWYAQIDSNVVRAHQHAAGARRGGSPRSRQAASRRWGGHGMG